jgi:hypothetical protein
MDVTTQAKTVYVVANGGDLTGKITSITQLTSTYLLDLDGATEDGKQANARWATGSAAISFKQQPDNSFKASPKVDLVFVAARISVKILADEDMATYYNSGASDGSLVLTDVAVLNARGQSKLFGTSLIPANYTAAKKYYEGLANNSFKYYPTAGNFTLASADLLNDGIGTYNGSEKKFVNTFYYYVFENDATKAEEFPTIVTLKGTYGGKDIYFPVHLASYEEFTDGSDNVNGVIRGKSYNITITLTGDPRKAEGGDYPGDTGGTDDPTNPVVNAKVTVSVELKTWTPVGLGKRF